MSQGDIEKRTGLLRCYLSRVENGHTVPSLETLQKIAYALDLQLAQFFSDEAVSREMSTLRLSEEEIRFLTQIQRYRVAAERERSQAAAGDGEEVRADDLGVISSGPN